MNFSSQQIGLLHHTLGLQPDHRHSYRNHYVAGRGHHAMQDLQYLEQHGLMSRAKTPAFCNADDIVFMCTDAGKNVAIDNLPQPPKRTKYQEYCRCEFGQSFADHLGINKPCVVSLRRSDGGHEWRMYRNERHYGAGDAVSGKWAPTKKEAKASYKAALQAFRNGKGCDPLRGLF